MVLTSEFARNCAASLKSVPAALRQGRCAARDPRRFWRPRRRALTLTPAIRPGRAQWFSSGRRSPSVVVLSGAPTGSALDGPDDARSGLQTRPAPDRPTLAGSGLRLPSNRHMIRRGNQALASDRALSAVFLRVFASHQGKKGDPGSPAGLLSVCNERQADQSSGNQSTKLAPPHARLPL